MSKRVSITLHDEDEAVLAEFSDPSAPAYAVLKAWAESRGMLFEGSRSEAHFLSFFCTPERLRCERRYWMRVRGARGIHDRGRP